MRARIIASLPYQTHLGAILSDLTKFRFLKIGFSPKASGFYPFGDVTALAEEGGVGDVV